LSAKGAPRLFAGGAAWAGGAGARPDRVRLPVLALPGHVGKRRRQPQFGVLDLAGTIEVTDSDAFLAALAQGFGRAKAFGCGLMLIRRAPW
jgi:CRISPR system Cascade subunit CasE